MSTGLASGAAEFRDVRVHWMLLYSMTSRDRPRTVGIPPFTSQSGPQKRGERGDGCGNGLAAAVRVVLSYRTVRGPHLARFGILIQEGGT